MCGTKAGGKVIEGGSGGGRPAVAGLFAGCGGLDLGFKQAGLEVVGACQWDKDHPAIAQTYALNHSSTHLVDADITQPDTKDEICALFRDRNCDVIIGSPPCTPFSTSGRRDADDPRGSLFQDYLELVGRLHPLVLVMENVIGILRPRNGEAVPVVDRIRDGLSGLGYNIGVRVLNAADYGVPQHRRRVIIIATRLDVPIIYPDPTHSTHPDLSGNTRPWMTIGEAIHDLEDMPEDREWGHIFTRHSPGFLNRISKTPLNGHCGGRFRDGYRRIPPNSPSSIIKTVCWPLHYAQDRTLTPREAARIQGFPDEFRFIGGKGDVAKMIGNAVPPPLAKAIGLSILRMLKSALAGSYAIPPRAGE